MVEHQLVISIILELIFDNLVKHTMEPLVKDIQNKEHNGFNLSIYIGRGPYKTMTVSFYLLKRKTFL